MRDFVVLTIVLLISLSSFEAGAQERPITDAETVIAIYVENRGLLASGFPRLILVAWADGHILWSEDPIAGGPPYRGARIEAEAITALLSAFETDGLFELEELGATRFGPDAAYTTILLSSKGKQLRMRSWHELMEKSGGVARKTGIVSTEKPRFHVLREEPSDYLFYRFTWSDVRARTLSLIPAEGRALEGEVVQQAGRLSWMESRDGARR